MKTYISKSGHGVFTTCVSLRHTTVFTYSHANMPPGQSEHVYYLSSFIKLIGNNLEIIGFKRFLGLPNCTWCTASFFSSNFFQIGQHVVLLHILLLKCYCDQKCTFSFLLIILVLKVIIIIIIVIVMQLYFCTKNLLSYIS